jgi:hypothetical protein
VIHVHLGRGQRGLCRLDCRLGDIVGGDALVIGFLRQRLGFDQPVAAVAFDLGQLGIVGGAGQVARRLGAAS